VVDEEPTGRARWRWLPQGQPAEGQQAAVHRLAAALRRANELLLDSDLPEDELLIAAETAERFGERLESGPRNRPHFGFAESSNSGNTRAFFDSSPLIGLANPIAPPLKLWMEGDEVHGTATYTQQYEGPPRHVHGGFVAASFDEVCGMAQSVTGNPGMTGRLIVHYRRPTPLYEEVRFRGWVDRVEGRKIFTLATLHAGETLCAEAEGLFVSVGESHFQRLAGMSGDG
jgi:acyl-coenzyme A thioesterase PaaI-like protein